MYVEKLTYIFFKDRAHCLADYYYYSVSLQRSTLNLKAKVNEKMFLQ